MHAHPPNIAAEFKLYHRDSCVTCNSTTPTCNCSSGENCILTSRTCNSCPSIQCIKSSSSSTGSGVNAGVIAGPVVAVLVVASLGVFWWLRRKKRRDMNRLETFAERARKAESAGFQLSPAHSPGPGSAHSRSPKRTSSLPLPPPSAASRRSHLPPAPVNAEYYDENGGNIKVYSTNGTINADPQADPFSDRQSISTMGSGGTTNIIPIQWIPPSKTEDGLAKAAAGGPQTTAAARLDEARQNLFKPKAAPSRPARSPDLNLRLNTTTSFDPGALRSPGTSTNYRDSFLSGDSAAPSYFSGQSDLHLDAPKIVTSKQVQVGRLQQAEMVQFGGKSPQILEMLGKPGGSSPRHDMDDPFAKHPAEMGLPPAPGLSPSNASFSSGRSGEAVRTLTPANRNQRGGNEERLDERSEDGSGDLRFSIGSLAYGDNAYRDSVSTMGTSRYLASAITVPVTHAAACTPTTVSTPTQNGHPNAAPAPADGRESIISSKSFADSVLGAFPMIPPDQHRPPLPANASSIARGEGVPHSTSVDTLDRVPISRPPIAYHPPPRPRPSSSARGSTAAEMMVEEDEDTGGKKKRPDTQTSVADSLLGSFPFVPPNMQDLAGLPSPKKDI